MNPLSYRRWFRPDLDAKERKAEQTRDAVTCVQTSTWRTFKEHVKKRARSSLFKPGMTNEQAASLLIKQTVYNEVLEEMERLERATAQKVSNAQQAD